jgi:KaiC/GvpD/RAD55 family RecA-like ATPase/tetratricopeptide (TPR) repeat protein
MKPRTLEEPNLIGRDKELTHLQQLFESSLNGKGTTVFVAGEAGAGKSRLVKEFLLKAKNQGVLVLSGWCLSECGVPYFPFIEAFKNAFSSLTEEDALPSEPSLGFDRSLSAASQSFVGNFKPNPWDSTRYNRIEKSISPAVWRDQAFAAASRILSELSVQTPAILVLEDVHWADSASLALLHYVARTISNERVLVIATYRTEELTQDEQGHSHPLLAEMRLMSREDLYSEIKLSNLNSENISQFVENMVGGAAAEDFIEKISTASNGNPLFILESVRMLFENKGIAKKQDTWELSVDSLGIPTKIKDIILQRVSTLNREQRRLLDAASVIGEKFNVDLLASVLSQDSLTVIDSLNFIAQATSIIVDEGTFFCFDHARSREVLYETLSLSLKRGYHAKVADCIEKANKETPPVADLAYHYLQSGNEEKSLTYSLAAGLEALSRYANKEAIYYLQYVLQIVEDKPERLSENASALEALGDALYADNRFREAKEKFEALIPISGKAKSRALRKAIVAAFYQYDVPKIQELTKLAEADQNIDRVEAARILSHKARASGLTYKFEDSSKFITTSVSVYEEEYVLADAAWDLFVLGNLSIWFGQLEIGVAATLRSLAIHEVLGDIHAKLEAYLYAGHCFAGCALFKEAILMYSKVIELDSNLKLNDYVRLVPAYVNLAKVLRPTNAQEAHVTILKALDCCRKGNSHFIGVVFQLLVIDSVMLGETELVERYYQELQNLPADTKARPVYMQMVNSVNALYHASKGLYEEADKYFDNQFKLVDLYTPKSPGNRIGPLYWYKWALTKQRKLTEADLVFKKILSLIEDAEKRFAHVSVHCGLMTFIHPEVNQEFEIRLDLVNASRASGCVERIDNLLLTELIVMKVSSNCILEDSCIKFKDSVLKPFEVKTIVLSVKATQIGTISLCPNVTYRDDLGQTKNSKTRLFTITINPRPQAPGKLATGVTSLDQLLSGGIPEGYSIALSSNLVEERQYIIQHFMQAGAENKQTTFYLTDNPKKGVSLSKQFPNNFKAFIFNQRSELATDNLANTVWLKGVENLTDIDIALTKVLRQLIRSDTPKRICIEIISDVLMQHHSLTTRKWLKGLIQELKSYGFTILAIINPRMHPQEEVEAVTSLFDGEIDLLEKESGTHPIKTVKIKRLLGQEYSKEDVSFNITTL